MNQEQTTTRQRILEVARTLFAREGFDGTSIRDVTGRAGVNLGAVTYHFGSKQALYEATIRSFIDPLRGRFDEAAAAPGPVVDRIEAAVRALAAFFDENPDIPSLIMHEISRGGPLPHPIRDWVRHALGTLGRLVAEGQADGTIVAGHPALTAASLIAQPFFFAVTRRPRERTPGLEGFRPTAAETADHVCAFIRRSLARIDSEPAAPGRTS
jgi:AcrR family transcriptional regulator